MHCEKTNHHAQEGNVNPDEDHIPSRCDQAEVAPEWEDTYLLDQMRKQHEVTQKNAERLREDLARCERIIAATAAAIEVLDPPEVKTMPNIASTDALARMGQSGAVYR